MVERPSIQHATSDGVSIAYTRFGQGDEIVVYIPPWVSNIELVWDLAEYRRALERSAHHHQVIQIDKRGMGLSDRTNTAPTLDDRVTDTLAVLDAEGVGRVHLLGFSEAGPVAIALASRHPERVASVLVVGSLPIGAPLEEVVPFVESDDPVFDGMEQIEEIIATWGTEQCPAVEYFFPSAAGDQRIEAWHRRYERQSASPGALRAHLQSAMEMEFTDDVTSVTCPVFIGHCLGDRMVPVATSRYLAHLFPDATVRFWDAQDRDFVFSPNWADIQSDLIEFITGTRPAAVVRGRFGVVLFTGIVGSTAEAIATGDDHWARLSQHTTRSRTSCRSGRFEPLPGTLNECHLSNPLRGCSGAGDGLDVMGRSAVRIMPDPDRAAASIAHRSRAAPECFDAADLRVTALAS